jgi:hypothetical protein
LRRRRGTPDRLLRVDCETLDRAKAIGAYVLDHHVTSVEIRRIHDTPEKRA